MDIPIPGCLTRENAFVKLPRIYLGALVQTPISEDVTEDRFEERLGET